MHTHSQILTWMDMYGNKWLNANLEKKTPEEFPRKQKKEKQKQCINIGSMG